ncbi:hypothetical protein I546_7070 [Mycobacterium kansasii 732]|nr:hypothetical protein I546_7070 [Mycobacterium kansasii 732]
MGQITHTAAAWRNPHVAGPGSRRTSVGDGNAIDSPGSL